MLLKVFPAFSPLIFLPEEGVLDPLDLDDPELGFRHRLVEQAVHRPVAAVFAGHRDPQEILAHGHWQPCLWEKAWRVGGGRREGVRRGDVHGRGCRCRRGGESG